jgi:hypothetical protein
MPLSMLQSSWMPSSLDMHFIIMPLASRQNRMPLIKRYFLDFHVMRSTSALSSVGGWFFRNILIGCIQSYDGSCSSSFITIRSYPIAPLLDASALTEGLDNFSTMMTGGVGALEEAIHAR